MNTQKTNRITKALTALGLERPADECRCGATTKRNATRCERCGRFHLGALVQVLLRKRLTVRVVIERIA